MKAADATITKSKLDYEDGRQVYDIEWYAGGAKYDYEIATDTGEIISSAYEEKNDGSRQQERYGSVRQMQRKQPLTV